MSTSDISKEQSEGRNTVTGKKKKKKMPDAKEWVTVYYCFPNRQANNEQRTNAAFRVERLSRLSSRLS
jgi:hypothetical protein